MSRTIDLVVAGDSAAARAAAAEATRRGQHVLVVLRSPDARAARRLRRHCRAGSPEGGLIRVMSAAEVVCVDGIAHVEVVVLRHLRSGRVSAVNASAYQAFDDPRASP
ncbi:MAG: hypothetical protein AB7O28_20050 [Vicinamibacterales bacterium]